MEEEEWTGDEGDVGRGRLHVGRVTVWESSCGSNTAMRDGYESDEH